VIECSLRQMEEYGSLLPNWSETKKSGIYLGSNYVYPMYGAKRWAVGVYVNVEYDRYREQGLSDEEIVRQCVEFLRVSQYSATTKEVSEEETSPNIRHP